MRSETLGSVVCRLRCAVTPVAAPTGTDAELVRAFALSRDPDAFEAIVRRHGPMVLGVCRRVLRDAADTDDAFQATFLVLVRKAAGLRHPERLAGWLHQVAHRTARKVRSARLARSAREAELLDVPAGEPPADFVWRELRPVFDQELNRLPDKLRLPAVLCFLEGHSKGEAARTLGWPEGTLAGRLQQAREKLRVRFVARGLTLSAGALALALFEGVGSATVPDRLIASTLHAAATGRAGMAGAWALADGVIQAMVISKLKATAAAVVVAGVVGTGTGLVVMPGAGPGEVVAGERPKIASKLTEGPTTDIARTEAELKKLEPKPARDLDRETLELNLRELKERLAYEQQMVAKGFMSRTQLERTKLEVARAEIALTKYDAPKAADPRQAAAEELVKKAEEIVAKVAEGVKKGSVPQQELLNAEMMLLSYKLKLLELPDRPAADTRNADQRRAAAEALVKKAEEIVARTAERVRAGIVPSQELLNAERLLLEYKLKALELTPPPAADAQPDRAPADRRIQSAELRKAQIAQKLAELTRAEQLNKQNVVSAEEVRRLRIDLAAMKAESATAAGDHAAAAKEREAVVAEWEAVAVEARKRVEQRVGSRAELRTIEVALAEAKVEALQAGVRRQLAEIVRLREQELTEAKLLFESKAISSEELRKAAAALTAARLRLAESR